MTRTTELAEASSEAVKRAAAIIRCGGLVAFPTETVYGLGASCFSEAGITGIYEAKGRPADNPLIIHLEDLSGLNEISEPNPAAIRLAEKFWPGPLTIILKKNERVPARATGGRDTVAVRVPAHATARALIHAAGVPIAAPSANASGRPSPTTAAHVAQDLWGKIDMILDGGSVSLGLESTIVDVTRSTPEILRPGAITREMITGCLGAAEYVSDATARAPGTKYKHYAPVAQAILAHTETFEPGDIARAVNLLAEAVYDGRHGTIGIMASMQTERMYDGDKYAVLVAGDRESPATVAAGLYGTLRRFDDLRVERIICEEYPEEGIGKAIMNRLRKACAET